MLIIWKTLKDFSLSQTIRQKLNKLKNSKDFFSESKMGYNTLPGETLSWIITFDVATLAQGENGDRARYQKASLSSTYYFIVLWGFCICKFSNQIRAVGKEHEMDSRK